MGNIPAILASALLPPIRFRDTYFTYVDGECYVVDKNGKVVSTAKGKSGNGELFEYTRPPVELNFGDQEQMPEKEMVDLIEGTNAAITAKPASSSWSVSDNCRLTIKLGNETNTNGNMPIMTTIDMTTWEKGAVYQILLDFTPLFSLPVPPEGQDLDISQVDVKTILYAQKSTIVLDRTSLPEGNSIPFWIWIVVGIGGLLLIFFIFLIIFWARKSSSNKFEYA